MALCKVPGWKNRFGHTAYGKVVLDEFVKQRKPASKSVDVELEIVNGYMTDAELERQSPRCALWSTRSLSIPRAAK